MPQRCIRRAAWTVLVSAVLLAAPSSVVAHGERSQEPFLRMRSILYYDVEWSTDRLQVNDELVVSGKFHLFKPWPYSLGQPKVTYLNVGVPGPVFVRKGSYLNGVNMVNSTGLEIGRDYEFRFVLKARRPGTFHVHPMVNIEQGGPIVGPGKYVTIEGDLGAFSNTVTTLTGETVDIEHFGIGRVISWHLLWVAIAIGWIVYWLGKGSVLIPRYIKIQQGAADELISETDRKVAVGLLIGTLLLVLLGYQVTKRQYPITVPLQSGRVEVPPLAASPQVVTVRFKKALYRIPGRTVKMTLEVTNTGDRALQLGEFSTASIRWLTAAGGHVGTDGYPEELLARNGLLVEPSGPILPGETKVLQLSATDTAWETEHLALLINDPDSRIGGLLMFYDADGRRHIVDVGGPIVPSFT